MRLRDFWRDLPRWAKLSFWASIVLGFACLAAGLCLDALGFWDNWNYGANMFTSLTSALFGVPFAGILVTWFTTSLESRASLVAAKASARALSASTWLEFKELTETHLRIIEPAALREWGQAITAAMVKVKEIAAPVLKQNLIALMERDESQFKWAKDADDDRFIEDIRAIAEALSDIPEQPKVLFSADRIAALNQEWAALRGRWEFLSTTVKAQRLSAGLGWGMPESADSQFAYRFAADPSPLSGPLTTVYNKAVYVALALAVGSRNQPESQFAAAQQLNEAAIDYFDPQTIRSQANRAAEALEQLQTAIRDVDAAGWPA